MSAPVPVPSKAAIHALRGLLFGTSCSLALLAEERRQRIKLARSAVENGRKLKSLKRYSTSAHGAASLAALQEEVHADPNFVGWSNRNRSESSYREPGQFSDESASLDHPAHDLGSGARRATKQKKRAKEREGEKAQERLANDDALPNSRRQAVSDSGSRTSLDSHSRISRSHHISASSSHRVRQVETFKLHELSSHKTRKHSLALILDVFCTDNPQFKAEDPHYEPSAALDVVRRAYESAASADELPEWLIQLSSMLCVACQRAGHLLVAEEILDTIIRHGPICMTTYFRYEPLELIGDLLGDEEVKNLDRDGLRDRVRRAANLYMADIVDFGQAANAGPPKSHSGKRLPYLQSGKSLINRAAKLNQAKETLDGGVFDRLKDWSQQAIAGKGSVPVDANWIIKKLAHNNEPVLAIDTFIAADENLDLSVGPLPLCNLIVSCVVRSRGYKVLKVLEAMDRCRRRGSWVIPPSWIAAMLSEHWCCTRDYEGSRDQFTHVLANGFYGNDKSSEEVRRTMVRICLEANDASSAKSHYGQMCFLYPKAYKDVTLRLGLARLSASQGDWTAVRAEFEAVAEISDLTELERKTVGADFSHILQIYAKDHTWGEVETFIETYVDELGVNLTHDMVTFIADRHAKCRDIRAFARWMKFCKDGGFHLSKTFWSPFFVSCRRNFKYSRKQMSDMYAELAAAGLLDEYPRLASSFTGVTSHRPAKLIHRRIIATRFNPADEQTTWNRMKEEAFHGNWEHVQAAYDRALHHNMGFSSRCLRLAVKASVKLNGPACPKARTLLAKARSQGHDTGDAAVPIILGTLDEIYENFRWNIRSVLPPDMIKKVLSEWQDQGLHLHDDVIGRATRICIKLRNYKEALGLCVLMAQSKGNDDLCYSIDNFRYLLHVWVSIHDYDKVRWLLEQLKDRDFRLDRLCRQALTWAVNYLEAASMTPKDEELRLSDAEMMDVIRDVRKGLSDENHAARMEAEKRFVEGLTGRPYHPADTIKGNPSRDVDEDEELQPTTPTAGEWLAQ